MLLSAARQLRREEAGQGEYHALLLTASCGMAVLVAAQNLVTLFLGLELLSIPLYVLCATKMRREASLESGLKYLIIGSVGSATLLYGLALIYGATGETDFSGIAAGARRPAGLVDDPLMLTGIGLVDRRSLLQGLGRALPPVDARRLRGRAHADHGVHGGGDEGGGAGDLPALLRHRADRRQRPTGRRSCSVVAAITILVGNAGALGQTSLKRLLAWSSVAQAGYMLAGIVVADQVGARADLFYLAVYLS